MLWILILTSSNAISQNTKFLSIPPVQIPGLSLWLRSDSAVALNGTNVLQWNDCSGNGNNAIQNTTSYQPILIENILNGYSAINFNGNQGLNISNVNLGTIGCSVFLVAKVNLKTSYGMFLTYGTSTTGSWNFRQVENTGRFSFVNGVSNIGAGATNATTPIGSTQNLEGAGFKILYGEVNSSSNNWQIYENGNSKDSRNEAFDQSVNETIYIGHRNNALKLNGDIVEIIIYDSTPTPSSKPTGNT